MQCNFVVDGNGAGAIPRMDKNAAIIGKFTLYVCVNGYQPQLHNSCSCMHVQCKNCVFHSGVVMVNQRLLSDYHSLSPTSANDQPL